VKLFDTFLQRNLSSGVVRWSVLASEAASKIAVTQDGCQKKFSQWEKGARKGVETVMSVCRQGLECGKVDVERRLGLERITVRGPKDGLSSILSIDAFTCDSHQYLGV